MYMVVLLNYRHLQIATICEHRAWSVQVSTKEACGTFLKVPAEIQTAHSQMID
jgi:hypothetical protein